MTDGPTVAELHELVADLIRSAVALGGPRTSVVVMVGLPVDGTGHDRFAINAVGPCLQTRGLFEWASPQIRLLIDSWTKVG